MAEFNYIRFYSAPGIYEPDPDMDEVILSSKGAVARLLGLNKYAKILDDFLIAPGKRLNDLEGREKNKMERRRNSYLAPQMSCAVLYVEISLLLDDVDIKSARDSEGIVWSKLPHKAMADAAFASVATAISLSRGGQASRSYDCILDGYYVYEKESGGFKRLSHSYASSSYTVTRISDGEILNAGQLADYIHQSVELRSVAGLFAEALTPGNNGYLHSFIAAWTGLEIFIAKQFKELQGNVQITVKGEPAHKEFSERMRDIMQGKYRLLDKFSVLSHYYCKADSDADIEIFKRLKRTRDKFFHSMEGEINSLPLDDTRRLLEKYLKLHLYDSRKA